MASHLEHLNLSRETQLVNHTSSFVPTSNSRQLNIKMVAACPHSMETKVARKRALAELPPSSECEGFKGDYDSLSTFKRARICTETKMLRETTLPLTTKETKCVMSPNRQYDTDIMRTPIHSVGSISDLSSIPEETELSRQSSSSSCDSPTPNTDDVVTSNQDSPHPFSPLHLNPHSTMSSSFLSPSPATPPVASGVDLDIEPSAVWLAPELQTIQAQSRPLLPVSIVNEM